MKEIIERAERLGYKYYHHNGLDLDKNIYMQHCLIQKWIYEKFGVWIEIDLDINGFDAVIYDEKFEVLYKRENRFVKIFHNQTQALEEGIKKALEILEK